MPLESFNNLILSTVQSLQSGQIVIYPTESVFGLGCDPFNEKAVKSILEIKQRSVSQGLIVIACNWAQVEKLIQPISEEQKIK
jgi:L-threonylcarbamoyladenylate synthase